MIIQSFPTKKQAVYQQPANDDGTAIMPWYSEREKYQAKLRKISPSEYIRREDIVKELYNSAPYKTGDTAYPNKPKDFKLYGACRIMGICSAYMHMDKDEEWPKTDNPLLVTFSPLSDPQKVMFCTVNYLTDKMPVVAEETC